LLRKLGTQSGMTVGHKGRKGNGEKREDEKITWEPITRQAGPEAGGDGRREEIETRRKKAKESRVPGSREGKIKKKVVGSQGRTSATGRSERRQHKAPTEPKREKGASEKGGTAKLERS